MNDFNFLNKKFVDFGSNDNGYYLRMENGFQICWIERLDIPAGKDTITWNFPVSFSNNSPTVIPFHRYCNEAYGWIGLGHYSSTWVNIITSDKENGTNLERHVSAIALGRWK